MAVRNLYVVLGVPSDATTEAIRSAYRTLAKECHPDRGGPKATPRFLEITEAYRVLSDPESRRAHNRELNIRHARFAAEPLRPVWGEPVEPLIAEPISIRRTTHTEGPSIEDDFDDWAMRYAFPRDIPKSGRSRYVDLDVVMSAEEAEVGGTVPIEVPVLSICPDCSGYGRDWFSVCLACGGAGILEGRQAIQLRFPGGVHDRTLWEGSIPESGLCIRIRVRIAPVVW